MSVMISRLFGDWRHLVEKPASAEDVEPAVERGSIKPTSYSSSSLIGLPNQRTANSSSKPTPSTRSRKFSVQFR